MLRLVRLGIIPFFFAFGAHAQDEDADFQKDSETLVKEKQTTNPDGTRETEIRSGRARQNKTGPRVGEISHEQQREVVTRVETLNLWSFNFGPGGSSNQGNNNMFYMVSVGRHWEVTTNAEIRVVALTALPSASNGNYTSLELGGSWFASVTDVSPILGATMGYGLSTLNNGGGTTGGFSVGAHAGLRFFRTAKAQLALEAFAKTLLISSPQPSIYGIELGILW